MPLFRLHRGSLEESLKTTIIVKTIEDIKVEIFRARIFAGEKYFELNLDSFIIEIKPHGDYMDKRCGWYTQLVTTDFLNKGNLLAVGYLSEPLE